MMESIDHAFLSADQAEHVAQIFKALADPTRVKILYLLLQEECSVGHITEVLQMSQSAISHQLSLLRMMKLVKNRRDGTTMYYSCDDAHVSSLLMQAIDHASHD